MFSRVPQLYHVGLVREKTHSKLLCHGGIKAREKLYGQFSLRAFCFFIRSFGTINLEVLLVNRNWIKVFVAAFLEIFWVIGLTHSYDVWTWTGTIIFIIVSNYLMITAAQVLPAGTVYAIFVGLGTAGTVIAGILFFGEEFNWAKIILIITLLSGVIGLKLVTSDQSKEGVES